VPTSEVSVSLTIDTEAAGTIARSCASSPGVDRADQAIVCLVGKTSANAGSRRARLGALNGINIRMISQGASAAEHELVVAEQDLAKARAAARGFFSSG